MEKRLINFYKGIAIFLVLWGHCIQYCCNGQLDFFEDIAFRTIYSFHMPLFMLISGYLFFYSEQKRLLAELVIYRTKGLLYPILMCSAFNMIITSGIISIIHRDYTAILGTTPIYSLWFLWSVLACSIATALSVKISRKIGVQKIMAIVCICIVAILPAYRYNLYMYPYFLVGYYSCKIISRLRDKNELENKRIMREMSMGGTEQLDLVVFTYTI